MLEPLFVFLLNFPPALSVFLFSIVVLFCINIFYKIMINQDDARQIKQRSKELNKELQQANKEQNTERSKKLLDELLSENNKLMKLTMKPMIISFVIVLILLPVMSTFYGDKFIDVADGKGTVNLTGQAYPFTKTGNTIAINNAQCQMPCVQKLGSYDYKISEENNKIKFAQIVIHFPAEVPFIGQTLGWLGWYILMSIPIAFLMRKLMKINI